MRLSSLYTFLLVLTVSAAPVSAQETFAPLITENTALFVHVDFRKVEINAFKESWTKYTGELIKALRFDAASQRATLSALAKDLEKLDEFIRPTFETITQKIGIREFAIIVDTDMFDGVVSVIIATSWKGKTDTDLQTLLSLLPEEMATELKDCLVVAEDFLLFVPDTEGVEPLREWLENVKPNSDGRIMQAMKMLGDDANNMDIVKIALSMTEAFRKNLLEEFVEFSDLPEPVVNILTYAARKVEWAAMSLPNPLMADKTPPIKMTVKTSSPTDARQLRTMLESGIDMAIMAWQTSMMALQQDFGNDMPEIPQTVYALAKGYLRTMLPVIEGDTLVFHQPEIAPLNEAYMQVMIPVYLYFGIEMMRQQLAYRKTKCEQNLFQIGLGIHNYHDVHNAIPPLYTVDVEGKPLHSWRTLILPFMEQTRLYDQIRFDEPWDSEYNKQFHNVVIPQYVCPKNSVEGDKNCHYAVIIGSDAPPPMWGGSFRPTKKAEERGRDSFAYLSDGTSNTLAVVEVKEAFCWMDPTADITLEELMKGINAEGQVGSNHKGGAYMLFFDASTFFLTDGTPADVLRALGTPNGGEVVPREWRNW